MTHPPDDAAPSQHGANANNSNDSGGSTESVIRRFLQTIVQPGRVFEVRALKCVDKQGSRYDYTLSGYYHEDAIPKAAEDIVALDKSGLAAVIYVVMNAVKPELLARARNRLAKTNVTTSDADIVGRSWLLVDCDPERPTGIPSSATELARARAKADEVKACLTCLGWPEPVEVMSGNGYHLLYRIDLPADDGGLVERVLKVLAARFNGGGVKIDTAVANSARITKVAGTMAANKGDGLVGVSGVEDRPRRRATLDRVPTNLQPVSRELLEEVAAQIPAAPPTAAPKRHSPTAANGKFERFDHTAEGVRGYLERHGVAVKSVSSKDGADYLHLNKCPVDPTCESSGHTDISVRVGAEGLITYNNLHNRGQGIRWRDLRDALEPGYKAFAESAGRASVGSVSPRGEGAPDSRGSNGPSGSSVRPPGECAPDSWAEPRELPGLIPAVIPFDPALLPEAFRLWIKDIADRVQCPIDFPAVSAMVALSSIVGRTVGIRPKRQDDWLVVPNLWGGAVGRPGVMKTPAIQEPLKPLQHLEVKAKEEYDAKTKEHEADKVVDKVKSKGAEKDIHSALKSKNEAEARRIAMESLEDEGEVVRKRYLVNDTTVERLGVILNQNPRGVLAYRDELIGFLRSLEKDGRENDRSFYLEAWNGNGRYTYDRIVRGTIDIEAAIVSIIGSIQPGPLAQYFSSVAREGGGDDGLLQRFQLLVWPDIARTWVNVDRWPNTEARKRAWKVYEGLDHLEPTLIGADLDPHDPTGIPFLRFDEAAQQVFDVYRAALEEQVRGGDLHPALESHLAKFRSLVPSLALLIHLADGGKAPVGLPALQKALGWAEYLESHARRIYSQAVHPEVAAARALAKKVLAGEVQDGFALRDIYRHGWTGLATSEQTEHAAELLVDHDWLAVTRTPTGGRWKEAYWISPLLGGSEASKKLHTSPPPTDRTDKSASGGSVSPGPEDAPDSRPPDDGWEVIE